MSAEDVIRVLSESQVAFALVGAAALAARGVSRSTRDLDLMTADARVLAPEFWRGLDADVRRGEWDDPLAGVVRIRGDGPIDVVVAKYKWQKEVIERAELVTFSGLRLPVPGTSDLILLKLFAGGYRDLLDVRSLLEASRRRNVITEVDRKLAGLPGEMAAAWQQIIADVG